MSQGEDTTLGKVSRRKKLAGYLKTANELRQSYTQAYLSSAAKGGSEFDEYESDVPGAFPNLKVSRSGNEELVLFPSYARRHSRKLNPPPDYPISSNLRDANEGPGDAEYWRKEWEIHEDANAVVDVDVRGWIYSPHTGPMNRKNRILLGIARHLSGIPAPPSLGAETTRHEEKLAERQAQALTEKGEQEADVAGRGGYSEARTAGSFTDSPTSSRSASPRPGQFPHPVTNTSLKEDTANPASLSKRSSWNTTDMTPEELTKANAQLLRRLKPFFSNPSIGMSLTIFYYSDKESQSRTTTTNESGHFNFRAALNFVPTHVRVLASEELSATEEVIVTDPMGVSLISDIDDTIKHSAIGSGAKEIFRNAFVRELSELTIGGVRQWYNRMSDMGVKLHYVSNSPWQMFPLLVTYFAQAHLPPGSFHLKQYSGMLQGIFEPVAERKKATLDRIMNDFPERRFILVGDSGEADLELYVETALRDPSMVLAIFIRDVTTSPTQPFFNSPNHSAPSSRKVSLRPPGGEPLQKMKTQPNDGHRPALPPRPISEYPTRQKEVEQEDLMSFSDAEDTRSPSPLSRVSTSQSLGKPRPAPPTKPLSLRSVSGDSLPTTSVTQSPSPIGVKKPPPPPPRKSVNNPSATESRSSRMPSSSRIHTAYNSLSPDLDDPQDTQSGLSKTRSAKTPSPVAEWAEKAAEKAAPPLPPRKSIAAQAGNRLSGVWSSGVTGAAGSHDGSSSRAASRAASPAPLSKREELWRRRWARAKEALDGKGVILKTWRVGSDVERDAIRLVERYTG